ncbi:MAG: hypothetical protein JWO76_3331 [Nocardioides sp.]|nr:hypothetical protein [Nocardioides sp.]
MGSSTPVTSTHPTPGTMPSRRGLHWASVVFFVLLGLLFATHPLWAQQRPSTTASVGWVLFGLALFSVSACTWARFLASAHPADAVSEHRSAAGETAVEIRLRTVLPLATALTGAVWAALAIWALVAGGPTGAGLLAVPFMLLFAAVVPDPLRALSRRPSLRLDADGVDLRGWSLDAHLDWDDVVAVDIAVPRPQRPVVRLTGTATAPSLRRTWHRLVLNLDQRVEEPVVDLPFLALDDAGRVVAFLTILRGLPREERLVQLAGAGPAFLRDRLPPQS